jgi:hypothetical protein
MDDVLCNNKEFPLDLKGFRKLMKDRQVNRREALEALMSVNRRIGLNRDLTFTSDYGRFMMLNDTCLCTNIISEKPVGRANLKIGRAFGKGKVGAAFLLENPSFNLILKQIKNVHAKPAYIGLQIITDIHKDAFRMNPSIVYNLLKMHHYVPAGYLTRGKDTVKDGILAAKCDGFTNQTCIHMILNEILGDCVNYVYQYDAFYCGADGYNIMETANAGDLSTYLSNPKTVINDEMLIDMIEQILSPLSILKNVKYGFIHADLKCRNIFVDIDRAGKVTYKLADFDKSSIFWNGMRFHNIDNDWLSTNESTWAVPEAKYAIAVLPQGKKSVYNLQSLTSICAKETYFGGAMAAAACKVGNLGKQLQLYTMFSPLGFFLTFDVYTFMGSCLLEPTVWKFYLSNPKSRFAKVWRGLFMVDQLPIVDEAIRAQHSTKEGKVEHLDSMRSISTISNIIITNKIWMIENFDDIMDLVGLKVPVVGSRTEPASVILSEIGKVCITDCIKSQCTTNRYSNKLKVYNSDACYVKK